MTPLLRTRRPGFRRIPFSSPVPSCMATGGPRRYLSDESGNVISLSPSRRVALLPAIHSQNNDALMWQVNATNLPAVGSNVTLRLRPHILARREGWKVRPSPAISVPK